MSTINRLLSLSAVVALLCLGGCVIHDRGPYRYENGDRIDRYGHRDVHWCDNHHEDEHCH
jgi:hypothetical protein